MEVIKFEILPDYPGGIFVWCFELKKPKLNPRNQQLNIDSQFA